MTRTITVLAGDGIGPEVIGTALEDLPEGYQVVAIDAGAERYLATGEVLTEQELRTIADSDALLLGAVGDPRVADGVLERGILLHLRMKLDLYINLRPFPEIDTVIIRENTEGPYSGVGERTDSAALETSVNTVTGVERCIRYAYELAEHRSRRLTVAHKSNVLTYAGSLWREIAERVNADHPEVTLSYEHADAAAYHLVLDPSRFDVIVTDNLFGDLLSDVAAAVSGGLGKAASANLHPDPATRPQRCAGLFEPVHGTAPDIAGQGIADPTAAQRAVQTLISTLEQEASVP